MRTLLDNIEYQATERDTRIEEKYLSLTPTLRSKLRNKYRRIFSLELLDKILVEIISILEEEPFRISDERK